MNKTILSLIIAFAGYSVQWFGVAIVIAGVFFITSSNKTRIVEGEN